MSNPLNPPPPPRRNPWEVERDYYDEVTEAYPSLYQSTAAYDHYFRSTQPDVDGYTLRLPTHGRILSTLRAKIIMATMVSRIGLDVIRCATKSWRPHAPLSNRYSQTHPLADGHTDGDWDHDSKNHDDSGSGEVPTEEMAIDSRDIKALEEFFDNARHPETHMTVTEGRAALMAELNAKSLQKAATATEFKLIPYFTKLGPKAVKSLAHGVLAGLAEFILSEVAEYTFKKVIDEVLDPETPAEARKARTMACVSQLQQIVKHAKETVDQGYAANRGLETDDDWTHRTVKKKQSRAN